MPGGLLLKMRNSKILKIIKIQKFEKIIISKFSDFRKFQNFHILMFQISRFVSEIFIFDQKMQISNFNHRKRSRTVRYTYPKMIRSNFQAEQSILKIDDFFGFPKFSVPDPDLAQSGDPRVISSSMAPWSSRRPARPRGAAPAVPDDQTHVPTCPQCSLMITQWSGGCLRRPGRALSVPVVKSPFFALSDKNLMLSIANLHLTSNQNP